MIHFKKILCPVDFFPTSERAAQYAGNLASDYGARLKLLHVITPMVPVAYEFPQDISAITRKMETASQREFSKLLGKRELAALKIETELRYGDVFGEIQAAAKAYSPDLLVMGTHGHRGFERWILGSTTQRMLRHSPAPMLTISISGKGSASTRFRRILVTTDFSEGTSEALNYAFSIGRVSKARVTLLHVLDEMRAITSAPYREQRIKSVQRELLKLLPTKANDGPDADTAVDAGTPYHVILTMLKKLKIDLLVMNTQGKGMLDRVVLGSTSERVLAAAPCPVLLIPPPQGRRQ